MEAGKKAAGEVLALQKRVLAVLNEARYVDNSIGEVSWISHASYLKILLVLSEAQLELE